MMTTTTTLEGGESAPSTSAPAPAATTTATETVAEAAAVFTPVAQPADGKGEKAVIGDLIKAHTALREGDTWYIVSSRWWRRWREYSGYEVSTRTVLFFSKKKIQTELAAAAFLQTGPKRIEVPHILLCGRGVWGCDRIKAGRHRE
jgi:hypothetical protein